jgi:hypothetical protein
LEVVVQAISSDSSDVHRALTLWQSAVTEARAAKEDASRVSLGQSLASDRPTPQRNDLEALTELFDRAARTLASAEVMQMIADLAPIVAESFSEDLAVSEYLRRAVLSLRDVENGIDELVEAFRAAGGDAATVQELSAQVAVLATRGTVRRRATSSRWYPGYVSDTTDGEDLLGRMPEIEAMAILLAARETEPPLSVGLFGDWGSGKTFFLDKLRDEIRALAQLSAEVDPKDQSVVCTEIRQIVFNAWHYTDANIWASLVAAIFAGLAEPRHGETRDEAERRWAGELEDLVEHLETTRQQLADADAQLRTADAEVERLEQELELLETRRKEGRNTLASMQTIAELVRADPDVQAQLDQARTELDLRADAELEQLRSFASETASTAQRLTRIWGLLNPASRKAMRWSLWLAGAVACLLAISVPTLLERFAGTAVQLLAGLIVFVAPLAAAGQRVLRILGRALQTAETVAEAAAKVQRDLAERRSVEEARILEELRQVELERTAVRREVAYAQAQHVQAERAVADVKAGRLLTEFVDERSSSADYRSQLGIVAMVRRDFDRLAELLGRSRVDAAGPPPIERIVLYIDDLDRCPPDRVVEVLQAVHLLLGLELFVVVVAVDPRWLLGSLELHYERVLGRRDGPQQGNPAHWAASPTNYLEKIFQIPYNLAPMRTADFVRLVDSLDGAAVVADDTDVPPDMPELFSSTTVTTSAPPARPVPDRDMISRVRPSSLVLSVGEREFMRVLAPLIGTPRSTKRLVNLYRLTRAGLPTETLKSVIDSKAYEGLMLLLALVVGVPTQASQVFRSALAMKDDEPIASLVTEVAANLPALSDIAGQLTTIGTMGELKAWIPVVSRYSFHTGH